MKRIFSILCLALMMSAAATAQSLNVHEGKITYSYPYDETTTMTYGSNSLTINGESYELTNINSITGSDQQLDRSQVYVSYDGASASIVMSGELRGRLLPVVDGANVSITDLFAAEDGKEAPEVTYHLSGTTTDGSFLQTGSYKCTVALEGISMQSSGCPMQIDNGKRIDIIVAEGTQNTFRDGGNNLRKSAFWVKGHAEFSGAGTLNITGTQRHAYSSNEYTLLKHSFTGNLNILGAEADGMHIEQYYEQRAGNVRFENVVGDNIDVSMTLDEDEQNGQVIISGGTLYCKASGDDTKCIKSETSMTINGGRLDLYATGDGSKGLAVGSDLLVEQDVEAEANAFPYIFMNASGNEYVNPADATDTSKCRGIKVKGNFTFNGGTLFRDLTSTVKASKIISIDGTYIYKAGVLTNCSISN